MKQLLLVALCAAMFAACNSGSSTASSTADKKDTAASSAAKIDFPYKAMYSSDFEIGDPKYAQIVLKLWKDYDNNTLTDNSAFADSVAMDEGAGPSFYGTKDSLISNVSKHRSGFKSVVENIEAFVVLHSKDKGDNWVCVWGNEIDENPNGKKDTVYLNENWEFNKNDKVVYISQFQSKPKM